MSTQTPYEQIKFIHDAIKDRQDKNQPTFFSVKVERYGEITPMVNKEQGSTFYETILQYLTKYDLSAIIIELYAGKAHNIKDPFQTFKLLLKKSTDISLGNSNKDEDIRISPVETVISPEKHFFSMAEKERQVMLLEFDIKRLQYENEELKRKNKKKKNYIEKLENDLGKTELEKKNSLGNVSFGMIGANAIENFAKSNLGLGILKNVFGAKPEMLSGLLGTTGEKEEKETPANETKSTATVITNSEPLQDKAPLTENEKIRIALKKYLSGFFDSSNDLVLRFYFEIVQEIQMDTELLQSVKNQVKAYREAQKAFIEKKMKEASGENDDSKKEDPGNKNKEDARADTDNSTDTDIDDSS